MRQCRARWVRPAFRFVPVLAFLIAPLTASANDNAKLSRSDLRTLQASFADLADEVRPSVVAIRTYRESGGPEPARFVRPWSQGTGVVFREGGYVLTNYHVIEDAPIVQVLAAGGREYDAVVMQVDERADLGVLRIDADDLKPATLGDSSDVRVGHWCFAVGNPFGLANFNGDAGFTVGNVSAIGRNLTQQLDQTGQRYYGNLIETSAAINPGNSGGPLFNIDGKVIGVVTAIETSSGVSEGLGFAIPISPRTRRIIDHLARGEQVRYGFLGVQVDRRPGGQLHRVGEKVVFGARIHRTTAGAPADQAGLRDGDVILEFDGTPIENDDHLVRVVGGTPVGTAVTVRYERNGLDRTATVKLADRELAMGGENATDIPETNWRGAQLKEVPSSVAESLGLTDRDVGLVVQSVRPGSDAAFRGVQPGQLVMLVNGRRVRTIGEFQNVLGSSKATVQLGFVDGDTVEFPID